jgi:hypothetical protein
MENPLIFIRDIREIRGCVCLVAPLPRRDSFVSEFFTVIYISA